jgi:tetratricopeptide (TPR) repeat protein
MKHTRLVSVATLVLAAAVVVPSCRSGADAEPPSDRPTGAAAIAPRLFEGTGDYVRPYACASDEARRYADQGLRFLYGFLHAEAVRSFEEAARQDPTCAFAWWGLAYAHGPHINRQQMDDDAARRAHDAADRAVALSAGKDDAVAALARAVRVRYAYPRPEDRRALDVAFADAMRVARRAHPQDPDVACVFAEALMNLRPWDLYDGDGVPRPETPEVVATLEAALVLRPDHPGANHAYIHAVEASTAPERGVAASDRLRGAAPAVGHLVHMPAHIDMRVGRYGDAVRANQDAIKADLAYVGRVGRGGFNDFYRAHNYHFLVWAAMFDGRSEVAFAAADELARELPPEAVRALPEYLEAFVATKIHALVRFGRWEEVLAAPPFPEDFPSAEATRRYARGVALAALGRPAAAAEEIPHFDAAKARVPEAFVAGNNPTKTVLAVAADVLRGEVAFRAGRRDEAFAALRAAVAKDDALKYDEPWGWPMPARHALGALLAEDLRFDEALKVYDADLRRHPENGWSLHGLAECRRARGDAAGADDAAARFARAWSRADVTLRGSCFCRR